ncbi:MAG: outer membrane beta-barrel protein [Pseudomonadales bacterium]|jgi:OOP family OmpA-OmpF porin|nr:outer membrane beta-barrel protein [Pseudomonadales bacterium]
MKLTNKTAIAAIVLALSATAARADNWYVLGAVGQTNLDGSALTDDPSITTTGIDSSDTAWKLQLGYKVNKNFAVEGGYNGLGSYTGTVTVIGVNVGMKAELDAWNAAAVGILPLDDAFSLFAKLGVARLSASVKASAAGYSAADSTNATRANYGVGVNWDISQAFALRAEYEKFAADVGMWSIGAAFKF